MKVVKINWEETIPIRHKVLWPNEIPSYCKVEGDETAIHFGILIEGEICCVASIYPNQQSVRLRKFATLQEFQGKKVGSFMLNYVIKELKASNVNYFWFDARESAEDFYNRFGFKIEGERFYKNTVPYVKMYMNL